MTIQALPQTTVRAIGASQVLTDPAAVVKELVDNAIDARATSIAIEIHANTLDVIQVRDNGHGIPPPDRPLVARRYCTSKLINEHDLTTIGGSSLGFRGEALASAAEMSGGMMVTTRVEGEPVATTLKISQQGEVISQERASTAVGTTVKIIDFIKSNPVRKQVALKHTEQCLKRVKHLLQAYAFSRPHVRLSLRVLKAKNDKANWMYAPKAGGNAEDAAFKVVGAACASQCTWSVIEENGFSLQAYLPRPDAAVDKISNIGSFISIDRRPVTSQRNVPKQIAKIFREHLKSVDSRFDGVKEPFLLLEIGCPEQSYDPNIEPAKDDVLFEDPDKVIAVVKTLFAAVYQPQQILQVSAQESVVAPAIEDTSLLDDDDDAALVAMLEQTQAHAPPPSAKSPATGSLARHDEKGLQDHVAGIPQRSPTESIFRSNMYGDDEDDCDNIESRNLAESTETELDELLQARKDASISNPWVMAKMNAPNRTSQKSLNDLLPTSPAKRHGQHVRDSSVTDHLALAPPTPRASSPPAPAQPFHPSDHVPDIRLTNDGRVVETHELPQQQSFSTPARPPGAATAVMTPSSSQHRLPPAYNYGTTAPPGEQQGTPLSAIPSAKSRERRRRNPNQQAQVNRPFVSPVVNGQPKEKVWFDHLEGIEERGHQRPRRRHGASGSTGFVRQHEMEGDQQSLTPPPRNRDIREFVASANQLRATTSPTQASNEHVELASGETVNHTQDENVPNNYGAISGRGFVPASELAALEARIGSITKPVTPAPKPSKTGGRALRQISGNALAAAELPEDDQEYRPQTMTRRRSSAKVHRTKSSRLPLERRPAGKGTHDLVATLDITPAGIAEQGHAIPVKDSILGWNEPAVEAYDAFAQEQRPGEVAAISGKLHELLVNRVCDGEMVQDLTLLVQHALSAHADKFAAYQEEAASSQEMLDVS